MRCAAALVLVALVLVAACGGAIEGATSMGEPCTPSVQAQVGFTQFYPSEVTIETGAKACPSQVCLVNHFRGRVGAPYGDASVEPQCVDRQQKNSVYCSCRCANNAGRTDDGHVYCDCAPGFDCTHLVDSIGPSTDDVAGSYCALTHTSYDSATACSATCDPMSAPCP